MKKIMAIPFTLVLALGLTACSKDGNDPISSSDAGSSSGYTSNSTTDNETNTPDSSTTQSSTVDPSSPLTSESSTNSEMTESGSSTDQGNAVDPSSPQTTESSTDSETTEADTSAESGTIQKGDEGAGPAALNAGLIGLGIPEGLSYRVDSYYIDESKPLTGNATILLRNEQGHIAAKLIATTMNMVSSQTEAVENVISLRNLDSYENGKSSVEGDTQYGENTYTLVKISTENYEKDYFVTYAGDRYEADKSGLLISLEVDLEEIASDDQLIKDVLNSITVVKE